MATPEDWSAIVESVRPHVSGEWLRFAEEHGDQAWIRLVLLVDAHAFLVQPRVAEKVAMTMVDLASGAEREGERDGWALLQERSRDARVEAVTALVDAAPSVLPEELVPLFARSIEPATATMMP
jgi:hypothetical protein